MATKMDQLDKRQMDLLLFIQTSRLDYVSPYGLTTKFPSFSQVIGTSKKSSPPSSFLHLHSAIVDSKTSPLNTSFFVVLGLSSAGNV